MNVKTCILLLAIVASACGETVREFREDYAPTMEVEALEGDMFKITLESEMPLNGFEDFQRALMLTTGMGQKRSGCDHDISNYACTNPVQWDLQRCGSNSTQDWQYSFQHQGEATTATLELTTTLHDIKADCPMQSDNAGGGSILVAIMLGDHDGVNRLAAKVWKLDLVFNSRTLATAVMWAEDISGNSLLEISIDSQLDLMVDLTSDVSRDFYTYFVGETVLVRHKILTTAHYEAFPISAWISPFEDPLEASIYYWEANTTIQEDQVVPLNFRYVQERTNMLEIWFCFDAPVDCLDCFIHALANVELIMDQEGALAGPTDDRRLGQQAISKSVYQTLSESEQLLNGDRRLADADSLQTAIQRFQIVEGQPESDAAANAAAPQEGASFFMSGAGVGIIGSVIVAALFIAKKVKSQQTDSAAARKVQPQPVAVPQADVKVEEDIEAQAPKTQAAPVPHPDAVVEIPRSMHGSALPMPPTAAAPRSAWN